MCLLLEKLVELNITEKYVLLMQIVTSVLTKLI